MDDILKYHRIQGKVREICKHDKISTSKVGSNSLAIGTEDGCLHLLSFTGSGIKTFKAHDRAINDVSMDASGQLIASCSDNGTVIIYSLGQGQEEDKEIVIHLDEPVKAVCVDNDNSAKKGRSVMIGCASGQLLHHKTQWFSQKNVVLYNGNGSPVSAIEWRGELVAWADACQVRVMNIETQSAICYALNPSGMGTQCSFPCHLFWSSNTDLFIGWADSFRHLELTQQPTSMTADDRDYTARTICEWQADCIICGVSSFDLDHVVLLGYVPPNDECEDTAGQNRPEMQIVKRMTGEMVSCDTLPLQGECQQSPWSYTLMSTFQCPNRCPDAYKWKLSNFQQTRGGFRGLAPTLFVVSPQDVVAARVRDVNDRIAAALSMGDVQVAVNLAFADKNSLSQYTYHDLVTLYLDDLLARKDGAVAAKECKRLIGVDPQQWERWVYTFAKHQALEHLSPFIPADKPRLPNSVYEVVVETFLQHNSRAFLDVVIRWGQLSPQLFSHSALLGRLASIRGLDCWCLEAKAQLMIYLGQYQEALVCYLDIIYPNNADPSSRAHPSQNDLSSPSASEATPRNTTTSFAHVFEMIEKERLFEVVKDKVLNLVRMSTELSAGFLVRHVEKLPVTLVVRQLRCDNKLLHWYLHTMFSKFDQYNFDSDYTEYHIMQVALYAEYAPKFIREKPDKRPQQPIVSSQQPVSVEDISQIAADKHTRPPDSDFMVFLKKSTFYSRDAALLACQKCRPPLYPELIYLLDLEEQRREAVTLLLKEIGDISQAIDFVEAHDAEQQPELWKDVVDYSLQPKNHEFLAELMDYIGICTLEPIMILKRLPVDSKIPYLRQRMLRILNQFNFQVFLNQKCNHSLYADTLESSRRLNQGQRRAMKVDPNNRCALCARPLFVTAANGSGSEGEIALSSGSRFDGVLWGGAGAGAGAMDNGKGTGGAGVVVFSNKQTYHRCCYDKIQQQQQQQQQLARGSGALGTAQRGR